MPEDDNCDVDNLRSGTPFVGNLCVYVFHGSVGIDTSDKTIIQ